MVRSRYACGAVEVYTLVRFRYAHRCRSGAVLHFNFLSGGIYTVIAGGASEFIRIIGDPDNRGSDNRGSTVVRD